MVGPGRLVHTDLDGKGTNVVAIASNRPVVETQAGPAESSLKTCDPVSFVYFRGKGTNCLVVFTGAAHEKLRDNKIGTTALWLIESDTDGHPQKK